MLPSVWQDCKRKVKVICKNGAHSGEKTCPELNMCRVAFVYDVKIIINKSNGFLKCFSIVNFQYPLTLK